MPKLTKNFVDRVPLPESGYANYWDSDLKGYGLRVTPRRKVFFVMGRLHGKATRIPIGPYGEVTPDKARKEAADLLHGMRKGIDPRAERKHQAALGVTLRQVTDAYMRDRSLKQTSKEGIDRYVDTSFAAWKDKPLASITRDMVTTRYNELREHGLNGEGPAPAAANGAFVVLRALFNYAIQEYRKADGSPVITDNPCSVLYKKWAKLKPRTTRIPENKVGAVWHALTTMEEAALTRNIRTSIDLIKFLLLTGARLSEASTLTWDQVDLDAAWFHLPNPKNNNEVWLPLSTQAVELLTTRPRSTRNQFVFHSTRSKPGHITDPRATLQHVSKVAGEHISAHDLRRTFTTIGVATLKLELYKMELLTNHAPRSVTEQHYLETQRLQYLLPEVQQIADWITGQARIAGAVATGANIVPLRG